MKIQMPAGRTYQILLITAFLLACTLSLQNAHAYDFGDGKDLGSLHFSGYSNIELDAPRDGKGALSLDELSLFASGKFNRYLNPFLEVEASKAILWESGRGVQTDQSYLALERLYNDFEFSENDTVRFGKMLTPVGEWNRIHAEPLVWTTIRPLSTYYSFPQYTSGLSYRHQSSSTEGLALEIYTQPSGELLAKPKEDGQPRTYRHVAGVNADWNLNLSEKLGISGQYAEVVETGEEQRLMSVDGQLLWRKVKLEFQATWANISGGAPLLRAHDNEGGGFFQVAHNFYGHWNIIGRAEYFQAREYRESNQNALIGLVFRENPAISYKFEYLSSHGAALGLDSGFYGAIAILF